MWGQGLAPLPSAEEFWEVLGHSWNHIWLKVVLPQAFIAVDAPKDLPATWWMEIQEQLSPGARGDWGHRQSPPADLGGRVLDFQWGGPQG